MTIPVSTFGDNGRTMINGRTVLTLGLMTTFGFAAAGGATGPAPKVVWPEFAADNGSCTPAIQNGTLHLGTRSDAKTSARMKAIFDADQSDRKRNADESTLPRDLARRKETLKLLKSGKLSTDADLIGAAFVFQHGDCPNHYLLAHTLAAQALKMGNSDAKYIFTATYDRWLLNTRKPQKYGTQLPTFASVKDKSGKLTQCIFIELPLDTTTTDVELSRYGLPLLADIKKTRRGH